MTNSEWYQSLPAEQLSQQALDSLPEYSISTPTGAVPGKVWKRNFYWGQKGKEPLWIICEWVDHPDDPALLRVDYRRPLVK